MTLTHDAPRYLFATSLLHKSIHLPPGQTNFPGYASIDTLTNTF